MSPRRRKRAGAPDPVGRQPPRLADGTPYRVAHDYVEAGREGGPVLHAVYARPCNAAEDATGDPWRILVIDGSGDPGRLVPPSTLLPLPSTTEAR